MCLSYLTSPILSLVTCEQQSPRPKDPNSSPRRPSIVAKRKRPKTVVIMRHGMTDWNFDGRIQGGLDISRLNKLGSRQARLAGKYLRTIPFDTILCSPLQRAKETLSIAAQSSESPWLLQRKPEFLEALMEIQVPWQGALRREVSNGLFGDIYEKYKSNPQTFFYNGFSPLRDLMRRARMTWDTLGRIQGSYHLLISHNQMNKALICTALGIPLHLSMWNQSNCCFNILVCYPGERPKLRMCNGSDPSSTQLYMRRARLRQGSVRLILFRQGHVSGLYRELKDLRLSCIYNIGDPSLTNKFYVGNVRQGETKLFPSSATKSSIYEYAVDVLDAMVCNHVNESIVVCMGGSIVHNAFFAACLGMGEEGIDRLLSDPGGVTIVDVSSDAPIGLGTPRIECYNIRAYPPSGPLAGYMSKVCSY